MDVINTQKMQRRFSGYDLKMIALVTMLIDHIAAVALRRYLQATNCESDILDAIYELMRYIGRMAFPIYCFLLVEGFLHTRSVGKYALRLFAFALLSEVPFDMALKKSYFDWKSNNVFFTLLIGLLLIWGTTYVEKFYVFWKEKEYDSFIGVVLSLAAMALLLVVACFSADNILYTDYGMGGVLAIFVLYLLHKYRMLAYILAVMVLYIFTDHIEILALFMLYPLMYYDGTRGKSMKYVFYVFYPAHLLILAGLCMCFGI